MPGESEERYRAYVRGFPGIAFCGTFDFRPTLFDGAVEKITGYSADTFLSGKLRWDQVVHREDLADLQPEDELRRAHDELEERVRQRTAELAAANHQLLDEAAERDRTESTLRQTNPELQAIYEGMADGVLIADTVTRRFLFANPAICRMLGYTRAELLEMTPAEIHPEKDRPRVLEYFAAMTRGQTDQAPNLPCLCRDGKIRVADISIVHLTYQGCECLVGFFHDVTERKKLEKEVLSASAREQQRIGRDLHDGIGQQLTGLRLLTEGLQGRLEAACPAEAERAGEILRGLQQALHTTGAIIRGVMPLGLSDVDLAGALQSLACEIEERFGTPCLFDGDRVADLAKETMQQLYLVAQEAATNAAKHAGADQIRLELRTAAHEVVLRVEDDGVGIAAGSPGRNGAGLRIMQYRADLMAGELHIGQNSAGGTIVRCTVPRTASPPAT